MAANCLQPVDGAVGIPLDPGIDTDKGSAPSRKRERSGVRAGPTSKCGELALGSGHRDGVERRAKSVGSLRTHVQRQARRVPPSVAHKPVETGSVHPSLCQPARLSTSCVHRLTLAFERTYIREPDGRSRVSLCQDGRTRASFSLQSPSIGVSCAAARVGSWKASWPGA